jgi:hypothetical protein
MTNTDESFRLPDWADERAYDYTARLARREWAWEFLRRNVDFRIAWRTAQLEYGLVGYDADNARGLQLVVEGADVLRPVRLMTNSAPDVARCIASTICV